jgi:bifunctional non-homologous end joining protein LigD
MNAVLNTPQTERITLYYREDSSDKVYQASIEPLGEGFVVNFAYGRRGSTMNTGTKTSSPVDYDSAKNIYDKLIREKKAKGYTEGPDGTPYQLTDKENRVTGFLPQLLNPIDEHTCDRLLQGTQFCMQEKFDGKRMMIRKTATGAVGINRKGLVVALPGPVAEAANALQFKSTVTGEVTGSCLLDGECIGDTFYAFDLLEGQGDLRSAPYELRYLALSNLLHESPGNKGLIRLVETAWDTATKVEMFHCLKDRRAEGVVFKKIDAPYTPGRPNSGGTQLKHKFYATCSAIVSKINDKRSVELRLLNGQGWIPVGNVTIPANCNVPAVGEVVDIRYLHAFRESNALYQPVYLGPRQDIEQLECVLSQLKYKAGEEDLCCDPSGEGEAVHSA